MAKVARSVEIEDVVRELGKAGPLGVFRALKAVVASAFSGEDALPISADHLQLLASGFSGSPGALDEIRARLEDSRHLEPDDERALNRASNVNKVVFYTLSALVSGQAERGKTSPFEGHAIGALQALSRHMLRTVGQSDQQNAIKAELAGRLRMASEADADFAIFAERPAAPVAAAPSSEVEEYSPPVADESQPAPEAPRSKRGK